MRSSSSSPCTTSTQVNPLLQSLLCNQLHLIARTSTTCNCSKVRCSIFGISTNLNCNLPRSCGTHSAKTRESAPAVQDFVLGHATLRLSLLQALPRSSATLRLSFLLAPRRHATLGFSLMPAPLRHATFGFSLLPAPRRHATLQLSLLPAPGPHATLGFSLLPAASVPTPTRNLLTQSPASVQTPTRNPRIQSPASVFTPTRHGGTQSLASVSTPTRHRRTQSLASATPPRDPSTQSLSPASTPPTRNPKQHLRHFLLNFPLLNNCPGRKP